VVVVCQKCRTRFQLDEARIPAKGVRVRCSKCKHAFFVAPPATDDSTLHRLAEQAAATGRPAKPKPGPEVDLPGPGEADDSRFAAAAAAAGEAAEDDWEFNTDTPGRGQELGGFDDSTPPPAEITDSEPTENDAVDSFFELDGLRDPGPERGAEAPAGPAAPAARATAPAPAARPAAAPPKPAPARPARAKSPIEPEQEVGFEDLGDPDSWDFGSGAKRGDPPPPPPKAKTSPKGKERARPPVAEAAPPARVRTVAAPAAPIGRAGAVAQAAAWVLAFGLFGFGLRGVLVPGEAVVHFPASALGGLEVGSLRVRHVENFWAGPLVVVAGELRNPGGAPAQAGVVPRLRIRDAGGASLDVAAPWLGAERTEQALREQDPAELGAELARSARALAERRLAPQESVRVQAVLAGLPPGAAGFAVEGAPLGSVPAAAPSAEAPAAAAAEPAPAPAEPGSGEPAAAEPVAGAPAAP